MGCFIGNEKSRQIAYFDGKEKKRDCFARDQIILGKKDRRVKVQHNQISAFPYNCIGYIQSKERFEKQGQPSASAQGTGFLISDRLVLTSSHNFAIRDQINSRVAEYTPVSFTFFQPGENGLAQKSSAIKRTILNINFVGILNKIVMLKKMYYDENNDKQLILKLEKEILALEVQAIKHDFALLELKQKIERSLYFHLSPYLSKKQQLAVTGYEFYCGQYYMLTDSNIFKQISNAGIYYDIDTKGGQSGCPVYLSEDSSKLVGIHKGYDPIRHLNFATMITQQVIQVLQMWAGEMESSLSTFESVSNLSHRNFINLMYELLNLIPDKGDQFINIGFFKKALKYYNKALSVQQKLNTKQSIEYANILNRISWIYLYRESYQQTLECCKKQISIYEKLQKNQSFQMANTFAIIAMAKAKQNKKTQTNEYFNLAINIYNKIGTESIQCPFALYGIGLIYFNQFKTQQALKYYNRAVAIYKIQNKLSIYCADILNDIGIIFQQQGKYEQALKYFTQSLNIFEKIGNQSEQVQWPHILNNIGAIYDYQGKFKQALEFYDKVLFFYKKIGKENSVDFADTITNIGTAYRKQNKLKQARQYYDKALIMYQRKGYQYLGWSTVLHNIGLIYKSQGLSQKAGQFFAESKAMEARF